MCFAITTWPQPYTRTKRVCLQQTHLQSAKFRGRAWGRGATRLVTPAAVSAACAQLLIPAELSHDAIDAIGEIGQLQFKDLNADKSVFQRTYANQVRGCIDGLQFAAP